MKKISSLFILLFLLSCFLVFSADKAKAAPSVSAYHMVTNDPTPLIKGTISGVISSAEISVTINGIDGIEYSLDSVNNGDWSITFASALDPGYYYTAEITATEEGEDSTFAYIYVDEDYPFEFYYTSEGEDFEFSSVTFSEEYSYDSEDGDFSLLFPSGTVVTTTEEGGTFDLTEWYAEIVDPNNERIILKLRFGIPDNDLTFSSHNVTITFHVGAEYNDQILNIFSRNDGDNDEGWDPMEIDCTVIGGSCSFDVSHASYFAISQYTSIAETEEEENDDEDENEKASISSWKAYKYEDQTSKLCKDKLKLEIKGKHFDGDAEVKIGNHEAFSVDKKSSKKIVAKFCMNKLLDNQASRKRTVSVTNPHTDKEKADKKINLNNIGYNMSAEDFNPQTVEGIKNIQKALISLSFLDKQYITGFYGPLTTNAVMEFQKQNGISQTGYVGPLTKAKLEEKIK
ncbi:MAG: peptidoglycan-binding protein [Candidatus Moranbacteria bacterium]|nr:peptidoglycan-binding protein [Candidatus Moranbacteria bacterium]